MQQGVQTDATCLICQRLNQTGTLNFCYESKEAAEWKLNGPKVFRFIRVRYFDGA